ncbi:hypothetical protein JL2886_03285 [Phaeobacter gallaeciensis]|uniref:DUF2125 domain-containing protein n=1 Tax=Phaeobacter gallaeciensis TaxID=60890 RepID=A0A1B0ZVP2_9RHOB|nr:MULTISPECIES: DUF2125 domain-containing protein [Phaeobacter]MDF1771542.1 DUF2125 domain-containing protein [Pseudophaeobacter sp. bin_em_oilr2.035]MEE2633423.1 DUF2125 domain-containing protein [Pseudomonadota bacterium]ANP38164.1 hypothetical protein JL2886_03285 [Phaeobacter gallaeciensis]MDE4062844.1 DUF2125 domain-containing protein [Phaeobacter gallaeciensis]MDE4125826.1 DUF2125 domain-containing protein [Phaeobacter gallaeciensis]
MRVVKLLVAAGLVWSLYWAASAWGLRSGIAQWFDEQERQGWLAEYAALESSGFPTAHRTRILHPTLADPGTGAAWSADWISLYSLPLKPQEVTLQFTPAPQRLSHFDKTAVLQVADMQADLQLAPGSAMSLERMSLQAAEWKISRAGKVLLSAPAFALDMTRTGDTESYRISARAETLTPRGRLQRMLIAAEDLPPSLSDVTLAADILFDTAWDRRALELRRPQPRRITLTQAEAHWGALALRASGNVEVDEAGRISGKVAIRAENWRDMLRMAERSGLLPTRLRSGTERILAVLAEMHGREQDLDIALSFSDGQMFLGPLPLGTAPRITLY